MTILILKMNFLLFMAVTNTADIIFICICDIQKKKNFCEIFFFFFFFFFCKLF